MAEEEKTPEEETKEEEAPKDTLIKKAEEIEKWAKEFGESLK